MDNILKKSVCYLFFAQHLLTPITLNAQPHKASVPTQIPYSRTSTFEYGVSGLTLAVLAGIFWTDLVVKENPTFFQQIGNGLLGAACAAGSLLLSHECLHRIKNPAIVIDEKQLTYKGQSIEWTLIKDIKIEQRTAYRMHSIENVSFTTENQYYVIVLEPFEGIPAYIDARDLRFDIETTYKIFQYYHIRSHNR